MAGYICKIVIEDTHPPVWRRVMIPEQITFQELHEVIQILFGWEDMHLHEFVVPSDNISISSEFSELDGDFFEEKTLIDSFFKKYKWIRYVYDFGDDWRHKINIEKIDEGYQGRNAVLMKVKGDNFLEDSGGIWGMDEYEDGNNREMFDTDYVEKQLSKMTFSVHNELEESDIPQSIKSSGHTPEYIMREIFRVAKERDMNDAEISEFIAGFMKGDTRSPIQKKMDDWYALTADGEPRTLKIVSSSTTQEDFLLNLGEKESSNYYRYLRIPPANLNRVERINAISKTLRDHPEYLLYVFEKYEYDELTRWMNSSSGTIIKNFQSKNMIVKLLAIGLGDYAEKKDVIEISLASDIEKYVGILDSKVVKKVYKKLDKLDDRAGKLLQIYCFTDLEGLYEIYTKTYKDNIERKDFFRFIYWHASFTGFIETGHTPDGMNYVAAPMVDSESIVKKWEFYGRNLSYKLYPADDIEYMTSNLANRSMWIDLFFDLLQHQLHMESEDAEQCLYEIVESIANGNTIDEIIKELADQKKDKMNIENYGDVWKTLTVLMLELELPMLKGRSRSAYAEEKGCSSWSIDMISENLQETKNTKDRHMYQFPAEVQEWMNDSILGIGDSLEELLKYKEQNHIVSEEYIYLLIECCTIFEKDEKIIQKLIEELKMSSPDGKKTATQIEKNRKEYDDLFDLTDDFDLSEVFGIPDNLDLPDNLAIPDNFNIPGAIDSDWLDGIIAQQPYIREQPKIGRNDPCPCGSGKKYKKCCGRGK